MISVCRVALRSVAQFHGNLFANRICNVYTPICNLLFTPCYGVFRTKLVVRNWRVEHTAVERGRKRREGGEKKKERGRHGYEGEKEDDSREAYRELE